jgi:glycosyltransferase involved in cell wall biosynthesis
MVVYVSESLNNKKGGGSSLSGSDFLNLLCTYFNDVVVVSNDKFSFADSIWYDQKLNIPDQIISLKRNYKVHNNNVVQYLKKFYYFFNDFLKPDKVDLKRFYESDGINLLFINSWSSIYSSGKLINSNLFDKICVVRGNPESFIWQSFGIDKKQEVLNAADYLRHFNTLIYVSSRGMNSWSELLSNDTPSYYLPNSINEVEVNRIEKIHKQEIKKYLGIDSNCFNIILVGSVQTRKGQDLLLEIIQEIVILIPTIQFHIIGDISSTWGGDIIYDNIKSSKFSSFIKFHGHSDRALEFVRIADICLFTSRGEAFPRAIAEYMAMGGVIVSSNVSGVPEMINHGENGFLYNINKPSEMILQIHQLYLDKSLSEKFSKKAKETYFEFFSKKCQIIKAHSIFKKITFGSY